MTADIDREKLRRPSGNNADEWHAFLSELLTNRADSPSGLPYMAVQISEAIDEQIAAQLADRNMTICMQAAKIAELEARLEDAREEYDADTSALNNVILNLESERDQLRKQVEGQAAALRRSITAIDDWLNVYASELCDESRVKEAKARLNDRGTLAYIAEVQHQNRAILSAASALEQKEQG